MAIRRLPTPRKPPTSTTRAAGSPFSSTSTSMTWPICPFSLPMTTRSISAASLNFCSLRVSSGRTGRVVGCAGCCSFGAVAGAGGGRRRCRTGVGVTRGRRRSRWSGGCRRGRGGAGGWAAGGYRGRRCRPGGGRRRRGSGCRCRRGGTAGGRGPGLRSRRRPIGRSRGRRSRRGILRSTRGHWQRIDDRRLHRCGSRRRGARCPARGSSRTIAGS